MDFSGAAAHSILAQISGELAGTEPDVQSILTTLTRSLSRIRSGTWFAVLLMRAGGAIIGTLGIFDWQQRPALSEDDVVRVQLVGDHVALALENARLQTAVSDQAERVAVIGAIALAIRVGQDLPLTLRVVVEQVTARLNVDAADVLLMTEQGNELYVAASAGFHTSSIPNYRLPSGPWQTGAADWRPHVEYTRDPDRMASNPRRSLFAREGFQTYVGLPLHARSRLVGVGLKSDRQSTRLNSSHR